MKRDKWDKNQIFTSALETMTWSGQDLGDDAAPGHRLPVDRASACWRRTGSTASSCPRPGPSWTRCAQADQEDRADGWEFVGGLPHTWAGLAVSCCPRPTGPSSSRTTARRPSWTRPRWWRRSSAARSSSPAWGTCRRSTPGAVAVPGGDNRAQGTVLGGDDIFGQKKMAFNNGGNWYADNVRRANRRLQAAAQVRRHPHPQRPPRAHATRRSTSTAGASWRWRARAGRSSDLMWEFMKYTAIQGGRATASSATPRTSAANQEAARDPRDHRRPGHGDRGARSFLRPLRAGGRGARTSSTRR